MIPEIGTHALLSRSIGWHRAADLLLSGRTISGADAGAIGLASQSLEGGEVFDAACSWAIDVATSSAPAAMATTKRLMQISGGTRVADIIALEDRSVAWFSQQDDFREAAAAFRERRSSQWLLSVDDQPPE